MAEGNSKYFSLKTVLTAAILLICLQGCVWITAAVALGGAGGVVLAAGSVSDVDETDSVIAVEKAIYAIEACGGEVLDLSFADGYVKGIVDGRKVTVNVYSRDNGFVDVNVKATKYLISDAATAEKILDKYGEFEK